MTKSNNIYIHLYQLTILLYIFHLSSCLLIILQAMVQSSIMLPKHWEKKGPSCSGCGDLQYRLGSLSSVLHHCFKKYKVPDLHVSMHVSFILCTKPHSDVSDRKYVFICSIISIFFLHIQNSIMYAIGQSLTRIEHVCFNLISFFTE